MQGRMFVCLALTSIVRAADAAGDPVAALAARMDRGEVKLEYQAGPLGYLPGLLKNLGIPVDSQVLVFSKTSFQAAKITPKLPRAIYFNDNVSVGFVPDGDVLELLSLSPKDGILYYTLGMKQAEKPRFDQRSGVCNSCHAPQNTGIPGMMATSVYPDGDGLPLFVGSLFPPIDQRTAFEDRWGGWYVTGTHGSQRHHGNAIVPNLDRRTEFETEGTQNITDLSKKVDLANYLTGASDIVALMTLEHQVAMTNYLVRLMRAGSGKESDALIEEAAAYMLFSQEMPIREPIAGNTSFAKTFASQGPRDSKGRSLRDFDLEKRIFRHPLSYMIYTEVFDSLRQPVRDKLLRRIYDVLNAGSPGPKFAHLTSQDRRAIVEIVRETKPNLPSYWK